MILTLLFIGLLIFSIYPYLDPNNPNITMYYDQPVETYPNGTIKDHYYDNLKDKDKEK